MKNIVCFHLFNDYSGSPKVLGMVLEGLLEKGYRVDLVTSRGGVLDELDSKKGLCRHTYYYRFSTNPIVTMLRYCLVQVYTFLLAFRWAFCGNTVFYINTLLPAGPALAGRLMGKRVVYHYHENAFVKGAFYRGLAGVMQKLAHEIVCVSAYQASFLQRERDITIIPNALPKPFVERLHPDAGTAFGRKTVLMLSSLKEYKGTKEFIELSQRMPQYKFVLVINDTQENIDNYLYGNHIETDDRLGNLTLLSRQNDVSSFYNQASVVLNLSDKERFIETFGLTALEAMTAGLPVIVPTVGGIAEMVTDGVNGYKTDVKDLENIARHIDAMLSDKPTYISIAENARRYADKFNGVEMVKRIEHALLGE